MSPTWRQILPELRFSWPGQISGEVDLLVVGLLIDYAQKIADRLGCAGGNFP